ncbi:MAG: DUF4405 domain-containing protein [Geobacter sp.]|nr:DUF4405 domain-containing protein [Geobacter sp.]
MTTRRTSSLQLRGFISLLTALSFLVMTISGIILFIVPQGRIASWIDWRMLGLTKSQWGDMHITTSLLFIIAGIWHTWLNWRALISYFKDKATQTLALKRELLLAAFLTGFFTIGAIYKTPPLNYILELNEEIKEYWIKTAEDEPPVSHAELLTLRNFLKKTDLELEPSLKLLEQHKIRFSGPDQKLGDIARQNQTSPAAIFKLLNQPTDPPPTPAAPVVPPSASAPAAPQPQLTAAPATVPTIAAPARWTVELVEKRFEGTGFGRKQLDEICTELKLDPAVARTKLANRKITAASGDTLKQIAERHNEHPLELLKILLVGEPVR